MVEEPTKMLSLGMTQGTVAREFPYKARRASLWGIPTGQAPRNGEGLRIAK